MLSFEKLKDFLILILIFGIIYWFQQVDDKKRCKKREGLYDNIKLPLLATALVGLVVFWEKTNVLAIFISDPSLTTSTLPTSGLPTSGLPTSGLPTSGLPSSGLPTSGLPGSALPGSALPGSALPGSTLPNAQHGGDFVQGMNFNDELDVFTQMAEW